ncbi:Cuticle-degrading protease [Geodia barretti]|uniref:Cuticle-degrading protease n=1 Tax=Geodia barretti TaxID=519541 RepID=A0AA35RQ76_GEOBA|nr:Cuticle-degrading protease [Geodia barretti]
MKILLLVAALAVCACATSLAPLLAEDSTSRVPGEYVVIFDESVTDDDVFSHVRTVKNMMSYHGNKTNFVMHEYHIGSFRGYGAKMDDKLRDIVRSMKNVNYIECSQYYHTMQAPCTLETGATWGIVRTTMVNLPQSEDYSYKTQAGDGVDVYIIDTGIYTQHPDFGGRAIWGADFVDSPSPGTDLNGHGTHVAGTVMSNTWGLAKRATSIAVRVLDAGGSGSTTGVIAGIDYVPGEASRRGRGTKSIANMSLGGGRSTSLNNAVDAAVTAVRERREREREEEREGEREKEREGEREKEREGERRREKEREKERERAMRETQEREAREERRRRRGEERKRVCFLPIVGSQFCGCRWKRRAGCLQCVTSQCTALGVGITSTWLNRETNTISGTSMAAPHVAGVMAKYLSESDYTPAELKAHIVEESTKNKVDGLQPNTPNLLVFKSCETS